MTGLRAGGLVVPAQAIEHGGWPVVALAFLRAGVPFDRPLEIGAVRHGDGDGRRVALLWRDLDPCGAVHPTTGLSCIRRGACTVRDYHQAERRRRRPVYRATDVTLWRS